jgi:hypothetical protein
MSASVELPRNFTMSTDDTAVRDQVTILTQTWSRDSHDLFDFETSSAEINHFKLTSGTLELFRVGNGVICGQAGCLSPPGAEYIVSIEMDKSSNSFRVFQKEGQPSKKLWSVVKANWPGGMALREGLVLKFGRFKLRVRQICIKPDDSDDMTSCSSYGSGQPKSIDPEDRGVYAPDLRFLDRTISSSLDCIDAITDPSVSHLQCRICLGEGPYEDDPLIRPCECTGSIRYVHSKCIGKWLRGRLGLDSFNGSVFFFRPLACELCHHVYPSYYDNRGGPTPLASLPEIKMPFVVFENLGGSPSVPAWHTDASNTSPMGLHVVQFEQNRNVVKIGRGHECHMRISDVSISRLHASIHIDDEGTVILEDQQSKFGTLMEVESSIQDIAGNQCRSSFCFQSGRTLISISFGQPTASDQDTVNDTDIFEDAIDDNMEAMRPITH